jgi:DNA-binding transcriptional ArsR family regulator
MPKIVVGGIVLGEQRYTLADLWIRLLDGFRRDYMPTVQLWDALCMLLILHKMYELHKLGREASATALSRGIGMPRATMQRKLAQLTKMGYITKRRHRFLLSAGQLNSPLTIEGFRKRFLMVEAASEKMLEMGEATLLPVD